MADERAISRIDSSEIISESMDKINLNFEILENKEAVNDSRLKDLENYIDGEIKRLEEESLRNNRDVINGFNELNERIDNLNLDIDTEWIENKITEAINSSEVDISKFIKIYAGQEVSKAMSDYAKTSYISANYVTSTAFTEYKSNAEDSFSSITSIAANSTFVKDANGYYVYASNDASSPYKTIEEIEAMYKQTHPDFDYGEFLAFCESTFKTVVTELATIKQEVSKDVSATAIVNAVKDTDNIGDGGKDIVAAIFLEANRRTGESSIALTADKITIDASHKLKLSADNFEVSSGNFTVDQSGNVSVTGAITATHLTIGGYDLTNPAQASSFVNQYVSVSGSSIIQEYEDTWLTKAFSKTNTEISGGVVMTGNLLACDSSTVTAGIIGTDTSNIDIKFFAGINSPVPTNSLALSALTNAIKAAPFRVYEDGHVVLKDFEMYGTAGKTYISNDGILHASGAIIEGNIKANVFEAIDNGRIFSVTKDGDTFSGSVTTKTKIESNLFSIIANGSLTNDEDDEIEPIPIDGNALYIKIVDQITNNNPNIKDENDQQVECLYGVPVLCMRYNGVEYKLSPASWITANTSNVTNMRWMPQYGIYNYTFTSYSGALSQYTVSGSLQNIGTYYLFNPNYTNSLMSSTSEDTLCRFKVITLSGSDISNEISWITSNNLATSSSGSTTEAKINSMNGSAVYALASTINSKFPGGAPIGNNGINTTDITEANCELFAQCIPTGNISTSPICKYRRYVGSDGFFTIRDTPNNASIDKISTYIYRYMKATISNENLLYWRDNTAGIYAISGLSKCIPFSDQNNNYAMYDWHEFSLDLYAYPQYINVTNNGHNIGTTNNINRIYVKCSVELIGTDPTNNDPIELTWMNNYDNERSGNLNGCVLNMSIGFVINLSTPISFNPMSSNLDVTGDSDLENNYENTVLEKVASFLENVNLSTVLSTRNNVCKASSFSGEINCGNYTLYLSTTQS